MACHDRDSDQFAYYNWYYRRFHIPSPPRIWVWNQVGVEPSEECCGIHASSRHHHRLHWQRRDEETEETCSREQVMASDPPDFAGQVGDKLAKLQAFVGTRTAEAQHFASAQLEHALGEHAIKDIRDPKIIGLGLALSSSAFIGGSFVLTRLALQRAGAKGNTRAGAGGFGYMREPLWWFAMLTMLVGELANFSAYAYAPAVLVTPLGAISIITTAILADRLLGERLHVVGMWGCISCIIGSIVLVSASPQAVPPPHPRPPTPDPPTPRPPPPTPIPTNSVPFRTLPLAWPAPPQLV